MSALEIGVVAMTMEDKWDIVCQANDNHVVFNSSWTDQLWCVLSLDTSTRACTALYVDSDYMDRLDNAGATHEVIVVFELVLNHVVFKRPLARPFVFAEPV